MLAAGIAPRSIARTLNDDGIPGPGGKPWGDTALSEQMSAMLAANCRWVTPDEQR